MKKIALLLIGLFLVPTLFLTSCDKGDEPGEGTVVQPSFDLMKDYMVTNGLDISKILKNSDNEKFVAGPPADAGAALDAFLAKYYIIDIRDAGTFSAGHIAGAKNVPFANILTEAPNAGSKPILIVCFSGQTACYATALLRLYGYKHTQALKWGMSGWNPATAVGSWDKKIGADEAENHANWTSNPAPNNMVFSDPKITTSGSTGEAILKKRVEDAVAAGFGAAVVSGTDVLNSPGSYFINNYFSEGDYSAFGHIDGAYRILPLTLAGNEYKNLDPDATVVTYCYTGQTSAVMSACLRVLGYDAKSLTYGMNGLYNTNPAWDNTVNKWGGDSGPKNLPLVQ
ncbi:rhodanese-like domain-containing protein [Seonamhaeicola maritimus]|nr:rhodanese-like domain-containing protein [Seonamhaeicola maritimus]